MELHLALSEGSLGHGCVQVLVSLRRGCLPLEEALIGLDTLVGQIDFELARATEGIGYAERDQTLLLASTVLREQVLRLALHWR